MLSRLSTALKIFAIFPPLLLLAGTVGMVACGGSIFPTVTATKTPTPTKTGTFTAQYKLRWRDLTGPHTLIVTITGTGV